MEKLIGRTRPNGTNEVKKIIELNEEDVGSYKLLGKATGVSIIHCFSLGAAHKELFWERVYGFRVQQDEMSAMLSQTCNGIGRDDIFITVSFYERMSG